MFLFSSLSYNNVGSYSNSWENDNVYLEVPKKSKVSVGKELDLLLLTDQRKKVLRLANRDCDCSC